MVPNRATHHICFYFHSCRRLTFKELGLMIMLTDKFSPMTRFRAACLITIYRGVSNHKFFNLKSIVGSTK